MLTPRVDVFTHNFKVSGYDHSFYQILKGFVKPLTQMEMIPGFGGRGRPKVSKVYASFPKDKREIRFSVSKLDSFFQFMAERGYSKERFEIVKHGLYSPAGFELKMGPEWIPKENQVPVIDFCLVENKPIRVIGVQPGFGKSFCSCKVVETLGYRCAVIVPGMYVDKWWEDIERMFPHAKKRMVMVRGMKQLMNLAALQRTQDLTYDFVIISSTSMQMFIKEWEKDPVYIEEKICHPEKFYEFFKIGTKIIDEFHKNIHLNIRMDQYTNVPKSMFLSGTIKASNPIINRMTEMAYPVEDRVLTKYDRYIGVIAVEYRLNNPKAFRWMGRKGYSQVTYEQSIMRNKRALETYTRMMVAMVRETYLDIREKGQTCLIFAGSIAYCTHLTEALKKAYPGEKVGRYCEDDPFKSFNENDIVVSTILSAGTAVDKYGLVTVIMSNGMDSIQANEQSMGRLRRLKDWPDTTPKFYYLVCADIPQHLIYHQRKLKLLEDKALWQRYEISCFSI